MFKLTINITRRFWIFFLLCTYSPNILKNNLSRLLQKFLESNTTSFRLNRMVLAIRSYDTSICLEIPEEKSKNILNQSVENACVAFGKGVNEKK